MKDMKNTHLHIFFITFLLIFSSNKPVFAQYNFNHGPYLQALTENEVTVFFTTSAKGFSHIELRQTENDSITKHYTYIDGLIEANNTMNAIRLDNLLPNTEYEYRLVSKKTIWFQPYNIVFGKDIFSQWYRFKTLNPKAETCSFIAICDIHNDYKKYSNLLSYLPVEEVDMVFLLGDLVDHFQRPAQIYNGFIDVSVDKFATGKPFVVVRGNHETRGVLARELGNYIYRPYYGLHIIGNTAIIILDSGEDKPDTDRAYAGIAAFDKYRKEQAEWLKEIVKSEKYQQTKHKIVMLHIPPSIPQHQMGYAGDHVREIFMPILNYANINLMINGHTHRHFIIEKEEQGNNFPILINNAESASHISIDNDGVHVKTVNINGEITLERTF